MMEKGERDILAWLAAEDTSAFGECHGRELDNLVMRGFVAINGTGGQAAVSVTTEGHAALGAALSGGRCCG